MSGNEPWFDDLIGDLKKPVTENARAKAKIMEKVREMPSRRPARRGDTLLTFLEWLVRGRTVTVSPLAVTVCALIVIAGVIAVGRLMTRPHEPFPGGALSKYGTHVVGRDEAVRLAHATKPGESLVNFVLIAPGASRVTVIGDFNNWDAGATPLQQESESGLWTVIVPLPAGRHEYAFLVDGEWWLPDPSAPRAPKDDFDRVNSIMLIEG